jgi:prepilin-type N-terminal cleavage/methylation domain-containing protein
MSMKKPRDPMANCAHSKAAHGRSHRESGVTLMELATVLAIVAVLVAIAVPNTIRWQRDQRVKGAAHDVADLLVLARAEAARTGDREVVIYGPSGTQDTASAPITGPNGSVPFLVFNDGAAATSNCKVDAGEAKSVVESAQDVRWGVALATTFAPGDPASGAFTAPQTRGGTTLSPTGAVVPWLLFRPDGVPVRFAGASSACGTIGATALGGAGFYLTNGTRDYAVVLSPLGGVRVWVWDQKAGAWTS